MKTYVVLAASVLAMTATQASAAQFTFNFVTTSTLFGGPDQNGNGIFTTSDTATMVNGQTAFAITGITGQINGQAITGLANVIGITNYNYFTTGPTFLDGTGVRFDTATFKDIVFFAQDGVANPFRIRGNGTILANVNATSAAVAAVPEPATWAMTILGFGVVGLALRRRQKLTLRTACTV